MSTTENENEAVEESTAAAENATSVETPKESAPESSTTASAKAASEPAGASAEVEVAPRDPVTVSVKTLLEAGAHYGHQVQKWNPKMLPYIYGSRAGVHIINLDVTLQAWERARKYVVDVVSRGGTALFVGTKNQAREIVREEATRCGAFYVTSRWLGGTLSNFQTIKNSIQRMKKLEDLLRKAQDEDSDVRLAKKEQLSISRQLEKLSMNLSGIREMRKPPAVAFVIDVHKESIAVNETYRLHIPVIGLVDTNSDPAKIAFPIPSNDDATRTIRLFCAAMADAVREGREIYESRRAKEEERRARHAKADEEEAAAAAANSNGAQDKKKEEVPAATASTA